MILIWANKRIFCHVVFNSKCYSFIYMFFLIELVFYLKVRWANNNMMYLTYAISYIMLDRELCYFTLKSIGDEEEILKSFMSFNIALRKPIVVPPTITLMMMLSQLQPMTLVLIPLVNCELCHSTSKLINDEKNTLKSFRAFDIASDRFFLEWL